jgi:uncharacterized protein (DUF885 family)
MIVMRDGRTPPHGRRAGRCAAALAFGLVLAACSGGDAISTSTAGGARSAAPATSHSVATTEQATALPGDAAPPTSSLVGLPFDDFVEASYSRWLVRHPELLTSLGVADQYGLRNDRLTDLSAKSLLETQRMEGETLRLLRSYDRGALSADQQLSYDIYEWYLQHLVAGHRWMYHDYPVHHFINSYNDQLLRGLTDEHPIEDAEDAGDYIAKLSQIATQAGQMIEGLKVRRDLGVLPPDFILQSTISRLKGDLKSSSPRAGSVDAERLPLYTVFREKLGAVSALTDEERERLLDDALLQVESSFVPAWIALIDHLESVEPLVTADPGLSRLPDGEAYYAYVLRDQTSTAMSAADIHEMGLAETERVTAEMRAAFAALGYPEDGDLGNLRSRAAAEGGFLSGLGDGAAQVVGAYEALIEGAEGATTDIFNAAPEAAVVVVAEPAGGGGFYVPASVDGSRPGAFHAGVAGSSIARYIMPTITYHEAVPGHHLQIALAQELDLPAVRRFTHYNAFVEGWALYAEQLAHDVGLYAGDPYGNIGRLELELVRALRLVVDTGIHSLGWSRAEARAYMETVLGDSSWNHEVERYVVLPGQATGYMIGRNQILSLRADMQSALGERFDLAAFHDLIIGGGSLPLEILQDVVLGSIPAG